MKGYKLIRTDWDWSEPAGREVCEEELGVFIDMPSSPGLKKIEEFLKDNVGPQEFYVAVDITPEIYPQFRIEKVELK